MTVRLNEQRRPLCNACGFPLHANQPATLITDIDDPDDTAAWIYHENCVPEETP